MSDERLCWLPATTLSEIYRRKEASPVDVVEAVLDRLERVNPAINAFVTVRADQARQAARRAQEQFAQGTDELPRFTASRSRSKTSPIPPESAPPTAASPSRITCRTRTRPPGRE